MRKAELIHARTESSSGDSDPLPEGWEDLVIGDLGDVVGGSTPSREVPAYWRGAIPWLTPGEITGNEKPLIDDTREHISTSALRESGANLLPAGCLLVTTRATLGERAINAVPMTTNQGFKSIVFDTPDQAGYFFHLLPSLRRSLVRRASGTTFLEISGADFKTLRVQRPPRDERLCIAKILDSIGTSIFETQWLVNKLKQVKQGMLHDLLTRGVDSNGELRPDAEQRPELYEPSLIGLIPKAMEATPLGEALTGIDAGWSPSCPEEPPSDGEWGVLKVSAITGGEFRASESKRLPPELRPDPGIEVRSGDVLLARANGVADLVGSTVFVQETRNRLMLSDKTLRLNAAPIKMRSMYLAAVMQSHRTKKQIGSMLNGSSGQKNISQQEIRRIIVAYPKPDEQRFVELQIRQIEDQILFERFELTKLNNLKVGLTEDLLTGRIRVTSLLEN